MNAPAICAGLILAALALLLWIAAYYEDYQLPAWRDHLDRFDAGLVEDDEVASLDDLWALPSYGEEVA